MKMIKYTWQFEKKYINKWLKNVYTYTCINTYQMKQQKQAKLKCQWYLLNMNKWLVVD